ncbi:hypothetical protein K7432_011436 [Basidiobolus ranarum]|uniref:Rap-GAP domain-containing protein n=1 Tax=Basidiobolus ranarum TaxID=34480 RepID=A0ABR2WM98_9FUNG
MTQFCFQNSGFYQVETTPTARITLSGVQESLLQEAEKNIIWYREHFFGRAHQNYLALESQYGPVSVSVVEDFHENNIFVIIRTSQGSEFLVVNTKTIHNPWFRKCLSLPPTINAIMKQAKPGFLNNMRLSLCKSPMLPSALLETEERQIIRSYKFGVCYIGPGQSNEDDMFSTTWEQTSPAFSGFLNFLGENIRLKNWKGYRAGLDVTSDNTGTNSVYTSWQNYELMFHVAPMLPYDERDTQCLERKRHIGNDIVVIVFQESDEPFQLSSISSNRNHIICLVKPYKEGYSISLARRKDVPAFQPELPEPAIIHKDATSRDFLLHILINAERASYKVPVFATQISRTRSVLLYDITERFTS